MPNLTVNFNFVDLLNPSTTTFTLANLTKWAFATKATGTITDSNFLSSTNADSFDLVPSSRLFANLNGNNQSSGYIITPGIPTPLQSVPKPGSVVALLGLGLGLVASRGKKQA
ncbi:hypothetical protein [Gloeothece verrucosa]|uniref:PEP-CTERM protein-sorting domain-containing protein n=1 Tax=Gloeothece verrucosa (strain PCC 7822) TaxID=497965 RepID=E0UKX8_GLOV7|nr:hypothetical protein [Gloeothece verrucosa]ADN17608.1 protein of unknown function DUF1555 [Gloeothece verrucosa PCC 7822]